MDYTYMAKSALGMLFFAPGVFLLAVCVFIGLLLMVEKALTSPKARVAVAKTDLVLAPTASNPSPGQFVTELAASLGSEEQAETGDKRGRAAG